MRRLTPRQVVVAGMIAGAALAATTMPARAWHDHIIFCKGGQVVRLTPDDFRQSGRSEEEAERLYFALQRNTPGAQFLNPDTPVPAAFASSCREEAPPSTPTTQPTSVPTGTATPSSTPAPSTTPTGTTPPASTATPTSTTASAPTGTATTTTPPSATGAVPPSSSQTSSTSSTDTSTGAPANRGRAPDHSRVPFCASRPGGLVTIDVSRDGITLGHHNHEAGPVRDQRGMPMEGACPATPAGTTTTPPSRPVSSSPTPSTATPSSEGPTVTPTTTPSETLAPPSTAPNPEPPGEPEAPSSPDTEPAPPETTGPGSPEVETDEGPGPAFEPDESEPAPLTPLLPPGCDGRNCGYGRG